MEDQGSSQGVRTASERTRVPARAVKLATPLRYIVVCQQAWCNASGFGINYGWDGESFLTRKAAIEHGFEVRGSDDFNVAVLADDRLLSFDWMNSPVGEDDDTLAKIARELDLQFSRAKGTRSNG